MMRREYVVAALPGRHLLSRHLTRWLREDGQACSGSGPWWLSPHDHALTKVMVLEANP
jgi:hypothetical protein